MIEFILVDTGLKAFRLKRTEIGLCPRLQAIFQDCKQFFFKFLSKIAQIAFEISILDTIFQAILLVNLPY